jgi:pSer/pThr/pTyr-binding forkhead associated (FHA) protein
MTQESFMDEKLIFQTESQSGKEVELSGDEITIGRDPENSVVVDDVQISRHHVRIFRDKQNWLIEDLNSTNGTTVNNKALKKAQKLKHGDLVTMGEDSKFKVVLEQAKPQKAVKKEADASEKREEPRKRLSFKREKPEKMEPVEETPVSVSEEPLLVEEQDTVKFLDKYPKWAIILMIAIAFIIVFCVIPVVVIEASDQWCNLFSGFFNSVSPGVCP